MANPNIRGSKELRVLDFVQGSNLRHGLRQGNKGKRVKEGLTWARYTGFSKEFVYFHFVIAFKAPASPVFTCCPEVEIRLLW